MIRGYATFWTKHLVVLFEITFRMAEEAKEIKAVLDVILISYDQIH